MRAELQRPDTVQTLRRETVVMKKEQFEALRVRVHLAGKSLNQLRDKLLHQSLALLGDQPNRDQVAGAVKHLPQFLLLEYLALLA